MALVRDGVVLAEHGERTESSHAGLLPQLVARVLAETDSVLERGDAVAVSIGPGSFTGLRIALSFAKGLAFARGLTLVGVPTLDALALAAPDWEGRLCTALDARKQEIYAALYERASGRLVRLGEPRAIAAARLATELCSRGDAGDSMDSTVSWTFIGDAVEAYGAVFRSMLGSRARLVATDRHLPRASALARLAAARLARDPAGDDVVTLAPSYLRPPEAELTQSASAPSADLPTAAFVDKVPLLY